jgi:hypothetical protein
MSGFLFICSLVFLIPMGENSFAIVQSINQRVSLYSSPLLLPSEKLADLPNGLIVKIGPLSENSTSIEFPAYGWIRASELLPIDTRPRTVLSH